MAKVDFNGEGQELERITAKKNYASSMQSHKMGSCAMFNELHKYMGENFYPDLINEVDGNYAVEQYPVLAFQDVKLEGTSDYEQRYIGLYTVGADKGDKGYFGFNDPRVKDKAIRLEGTDHIKGVGFNYPWRVNGVRNIRYNHDKEALCIVTGEDKTKWTAILEQSYCGTAETEAEIEAYLEEKFMPIYELAYNNNPLLVGTSMNIDAINADVDAFGSLRRTDGRPYSYCEFWIDGEYDVYYLNQERNRYEKNGLNLYNVLSDEDKARVDAASSLDEKNEIFIKHRVNAFKAVAENYICIDDALFLIVFCLVVVASDNFEKNMYPYIMDFLLRFFNDDLDSIFSTDNQAQDTKNYSAELHDFTDDTMSAYVFKGEDNALFNLIEMAYPERLMKMGKDMLQSMYDLSKKGTKTLDRLNGYYDQTFFDKAQNYYPISAYNNDSEVSYLEAWNDKDYVASVDIHPLAQSLGNHYTTEKRFVNLRNVYLMSKFGFGGFASYEDNSLGVISVRTQKPVGFTLTPAIDMYPTILGGQAQVSKSDRRIKAGESVTLAAVGGGNTNVYIVAADYLTDIGDLKDLSIDPSSDVSLNVSSKRLRWLKLGDEDAAAVTSYLAGLNIQKCDSLETIDARNLVSLKGDVDLTNCPRLYAALFKGTSTKKINIPVGSKIEILTLPDTVTTLVLNKLQNLTEEGLDFGTLGKLAYLRLESNKKLDGWELMKTAQQNSDQLTHIRVIGFDKVGDSNDFNFIMQLTNGEYHGIDAEGNADNTGYPIIEGKLHIAGSASQANIDFLKGKFPALVLTADQIVNYFKFADPEVSRIVAQNWGDGTGTSLEQIEAITNIGTKFANNTLIETFDELKDLKNVQSLSTNAFSNCTNLKSIDLSNIKVFDGTYYNRGTFNGCTSLQDIGSLENLEAITPSAFNGCTNLIQDIYMPKLKKFYTNQTFANSGITKFEAPNITSYERASGAGSGVFDNCKNLVEISIPIPIDASWAFANGCSNLEKINAVFAYIDEDAFRDCTKLKSFNFENVTNLGANCFLNVSMELDELNVPKLVGTLYRGVFSKFKIKRIVDLGSITSLTYISADDCLFGDPLYLKSVVLPATLTSMGSGYRPFNGYYNLEYIIIKAITPPTFANNSGDMGNNCPIYVPDASVEAYKTATNWINYAPRIQSIFYYLGYIDFVDPAVRDICVANFDTDGDGVVSMEEAAAVTDIGTLFKGNTTIKYFDEFGKFTNAQSIPASAFEGDTKLERIDLIKATSLGDKSFYGCTSLAIEDLNLPNCENLGAGAFADSGIKSITNLGKVDTIHPNTFVNCKNLASINLPDGLTVIEYCGFANCTNLVYDVGNLPESLKLITGGFINCPKVYGEINLPNLEVLDGSAFSNTPISKALNLGKIETIGSYVFDELNQGSNTLTYAKIPSTVKNIGDGAFRNCLALTQVDGMDGNNSIEEVKGGAFAMCRALKIGLDLPNIISIDAYGFSECNKFEYVILGSKIKTISSHAFSWCNTMKFVMIKATTPPALGESAFAETGNCPIYVPDASVEAYKTATGWVDYATRIKPLSEYVES